MAINLYIGFAQPDEWENWAGTYARHTQRFEAASGGIPCLPLPYWHATPDRMRHLAPQAVVMSGFARSFEAYKVSSLYAIVDWLQETRIPVLALCGSHQLLGFLFNQDIRQGQQLCDEPMRRLRHREPVTHPDYHPDFLMEHGFHALDLTKAGQRDPLFENLASPPLVYESHYCEVKKLPPNFELLASTPECHIQAMRHHDRLLYGFQFHPEDYRVEPERFSDGKRLLENFFRLAAEWNP